MCIRDRFYTAHIGDSRIYRMRDGRLELLTVDHIWEHPELKNVLSRAIGLDPRVLMDFADDELAANDRFLLVSDGVWGVLPDALTAAVLLDHPEPQGAAAAPPSPALAPCGPDNAQAGGTQRTRPAATEGGGGGLQDGPEVEAAFRDIAERCDGPGTRCRLEGSISKAPMEPNPWLISLAHQAAAELGFSLAEFTSGGTSDASFIALTGTPVLDGLGPVGAKDHSPEEYLLVESVVPRTALLAQLMMSIARAVNDRSETDND